MSRICPFDGCSFEVPSHLFACGHHWSLLDTAQRGEIYAAHDEWQAGTISAMELRGRQRAVIDQVQVPRRGRGAGK